MKLLILTAACLAVLTFAAPMNPYASLNNFSSRQSNCERLCEWLRRRGRTHPACPCRPSDPPATPTDAPTPIKPPTNPCRTPPSPPTNPAPTSAPMPSSIPGPTPIAEPAPPSDPTPPSSDKMTACLAEHNKERAAVGVAPVKWSTKLEATAQQWANTIKDERTLRHSKGVFPGTGENLSMFFGGSSMPSWVDFQRGWISEKKDFKNGLFPDVSTTGNWMDVGHYTAMVWRDVTEIGCAASEGYGYKFVCHYTPHPNVSGQRVF